jgi:hypothetical protein
VLGLLHRNLVAVRVLSDEKREADLPKKTPTVFQIIALQDLPRRGADVARSSWMTGLRGRWLNER